MDVPPQSATADGALLVRQRSADSNVPTTNGAFTLLEDDRDWIQIVSSEKDSSSSHRPSSLSKDPPSVSSMSSASAVSYSNPSLHNNNNNNKCGEGSEAESLPSRASSGKRRLWRRHSTAAMAHWKAAASHHHHPPSEQQQPHCQHQHAYEWPNFPHLFQLTAALSLCTLLATGAAWDAEWQCVVTNNYLNEYRNSNNNYNNNYEDAADADQQNPSQDNAEDDDFNNNNNLNVSKEDCIRMLQTIVLPSAGVTLMGALAVLAVIWRSNRRFSISTPPWSQVRNVLAVLCVLFGLVLAAQCYSTMAIMLQPTHTSSSATTASSSESASSALYSSNYENNNNNEIRRSNGNPYESLAAVDRFGQVGDNANLYYLTWISLSLAIAVMYQSFTALLRARRAARREQRHPTVPPLERMYSSTPQELLLPATTTTTAPWETTNHTTDRAAVKDGEGDEDNDDDDAEYYDATVYYSRAAWYTSMSRLRVRTGVWTAAAVSCLILVASAQCMWKQVLWPAVVAVYDDDKDEPWLFRDYFAVCQAASLQTESSAVDDSYSYFTPQLCRRTVAAWFSGLVAALFCATAIVLHLMAKYKHSHKNKGEINSTDKGEEDFTAASPQYYLNQDIMELLAGGPPDLCSNYSNAVVTAPDEAYKERDESRVVATSASFYDFYWQTNTNANSPFSLFSRYYSHYHPKRLSLRTELLLAVVLSLLLGINAVIVTGSQGPAAKVGNLYYASWLSFLLCIRICLGCVEEFYNIEAEDEESDDEEIVVVKKDSASQQSKSSDAANQHQEQQLNANQYVAPYYDGERVIPTQASGLAEDGGVNSVEDSSTTDNTNKTAIAKQETKRLIHVRCYFFLAVFSTICGAAAFDAAWNTDQTSSSLTRVQLYIMVAPCVVALVSYLLFVLCLSKTCYPTVSRFNVGGILSIISFYLLFGEMILTMHSESSWAVNGVGEILNANLYYFSWASVLTGGIIMTLYVKAAVGVKKLDLTSVLWSSIVKVCFIMLGASLHIWHTIADTCEFDEFEEISLNAVTFCDRTVLALVVSLTGILVAGLVLLGRLVSSLFAPSVAMGCCCGDRGRALAHLELLVSLFFVFLFIAAVALITGIGGPGQTVGDMFYSTWLAFWVSLGISIQSFKQLNTAETVADSSELKPKSPSQKIPLARANTVLV